MNKKVFFTDLDKTLLNSEKKITPATKAVLRKFVDAGNLVVPCTGRPTGALMTAFKTIGLDEFCRYVISYNGGEIFDMQEKKILFRTTLTDQQIREADKIAAEHGIYNQVFTDTHIISHISNECTERFTKYEYMPVTLAEDLVEGLDGYKPGKMLFIELEDSDRLEDCRLALVKHFGDSAYVCYSDPIYMELMPPDSGKGNGIKNFCKLMNIPIENTIAAGDEGNDVPMVLTAKHGIAMLNGIDAIKEAADYITESDNDHDGLVPLLEKFI